MPEFPNVKLAKSLEEAYCQLKQLKIQLENNQILSAASSVDNAMSDIWKAIEALGKKPNPPC
jgi:hypothetical protein